MAAALGVPRERRDLAQVALGQGAPEALLERLEALGSDPVFETVGELWITLGGADEERSTAPEPVPAVVEETALDDLDAENVTPITQAPPIPTVPPSDGWADAPLAPAIGDGAGLVAGTLVRLITLPPRVVIGVAQTASGLVGRGLAALASLRPSG